MNVPQLFIGLGWDPYVVLGFGLGGVTLIFLRGSHSPPLALPQFDVWLRPDIPLKVQMLAWLRKIRIIIPVKYFFITALAMFPKFWSINMLRAYRIFGQCAVLVSMTTMKSVILFPGFREPVSGLVLSMASVALFSKGLLFFFVSSVTVWYLMTPYLVRPHPQFTDDM